MNYDYSARNWKLLISDIMPAFKVHDISETWYSAFVKTLLMEPYAVSIQMMSISNWTAHTIGLMSCKLTRCSSPSFPGPPQLWCNAAGQKPPSSTWHTEQPRQCPPSSRSSSLHQRTWYGAASCQEDILQARVTIKGLLSPATAYSDRTSSMLSTWIYQWIHEWAP